MPGWIYMDYLVQLIERSVELLSLRKGRVIMVHESISSPHRRAQPPVSPLSGSLRRQLQSREDGWMTLFRRHQFLLTTLAVLTFLCTVYLYFAITLGNSECSGLSGKQKALCHLGQMKTSMRRTGKLKFF